MKPLKILILVLSICLTSSLVAQTVYTTDTGEKYHLNNCRYLKYSKTKRELKDAISLGYEACKVCKPSKGNTESNSSTKSKSSPSSSSRSIHSTSIKRTSSTSSQCTGKTKSGSRCKRKTKSASGRCYQH